MPPSRYFGSFPEPWIPEIGYVLHEPVDRKEELEDDHGIRGECSEIIREVPENARRKPSLCFIALRAGRFRTWPAPKPAIRRGRAMIGLRRSFCNRDWRWLWS